MKNYSLRYIGTMAVLGALILPQFSFAAGRGEVMRGSKPERSENVDAGKNFCVMIANRPDINKNLDDKAFKLDEKRRENAQKKSTKRADHDTKLTQGRDGWDKKSAERFAQLEAKATTDVQKAAVAEFKSTITAAITARRTAIDTAITTFRSAVDALNTSHKTTVDTALANLKNARQAAIDKAKADCTAGVDPKIAKATFDTAMKAAGDAFKAAKDAAIKQSDVDALAQARKTAIEKAMNDFKTTLQAAVAKLQLVFPKAE